ncbi:MAG: ABC transporter permease [Myxococcota bacterium]
MNRLWIYLHEAGREVRQAMSGPQIPLMVLGLVGYLLVVVTSADYMREMGAADITRNSPHLVYLMTTGEGFWLAFAFAWVFAQIVTRDQDAHLHEMVLAAPVSLRGLLVARFAGAFLVACVLGLATPLAFVLVPPLETIGVLPPGSTGPTPWHAILWSFAVFVIPMALGLGALYAAVAIRTRSTAGPFATAAAVAIIWMVAMVVIRGGGLDRDLATWLDPTAYAEAEHQTERWTPAEKMSSLLVFSRALGINRLVWTVTPMVFLWWTLLGLHRESLTIGRGRKSRGPKPARKRPSPSGPLRAPSFTTRAWVRATINEAAWHFALTTRGWGFRLIAFMLFVVGVAGSVVHLVAHVDGPFVPRPEVLAPLLAEFSFVGIVFIIAGVVGVMARRDDRLGFSEISASTPAPIWVHVVGRTLAAVALTLVMAAVPMLSGLCVTALFAPESLGLTIPIYYMLFSFFPALLEVCALTLLVHALLRSAGVAHALTMLFAFIAVINHEVSLVAYPPYQLAIPAHVTLSELTGFGAWWGPVLAIDAFKLGIVLLLVAATWLAWRRGTEVDLTDRITLASRRSRGGAGVLAVAAIALLLSSGSVLHDRLVVHGEFASVAEDRRERAEWERRWWRHAVPFSVDGGELTAVLQPSKRRVDVRWRLSHVRSQGNRLDFALPHGVRVDGAHAGGAALRVEQGFDHAVVRLDGCGVPCHVELNLSGELLGWPVDDRPPWLSSAGVDARASDFVPRLGHEGERALRGVALRQSHGLPAATRSLLPDAYRSALGVAPRGDWQVEIVVDDGEREVVLSRAWRGPLDFAVAWPASRPQTTRAGDLMARHGPTHRRTATELLDDALTMQRCVEAMLGRSIDIGVVHQAPRGLGPIALHGSTLWVPEEEGWDAGSEGPSRWQRRANLAHALAAQSLVDGANLRAEPGSPWLTDGLAGWIGLECVRTNDGADAWQALMQRRSDRVVEALGALDAPVQGFSSDGAADWVPEYAPLAAQGWAMSVGKDVALGRVTELVIALREGHSVVDALRKILGSEEAERILGPPYASDAAVEVLADGKRRARGSRWSWGEGGWRDRSEVGRFVEVADLPNGSFHTIDAETAPYQGAIAVFDAWPSFERAPKDNFWAEESSQTQGAP